jgi:hypothetical protein
MDHQPATPRTERDGNNTECTSAAVAVYNDIGEKLFADDEEPCPFVISKATIAGERLGKFLEAGELKGLAA